MSICRKNDVECSNRTGEGIPRWQWVWNWMLCSDAVCDCVFGEMKKDFYSWINDQRGRKKRVNIFNRIFIVCQEWAFELFNLFYRERDIIFMLFRAMYNVACSSGHPHPGPTIVRWETKSSQNACMFLNFHLIFIDIFHSISSNIQSNCYSNSWAHNVHDVDVREL